MRISLFIVTVFLGHKPGHACPHCPGGFRAVVASGVAAVALAELKVSSLALCGRSLTSELEQEMSRYSECTAWVTREETSGRHVGLCAQTLFCVGTGTLGSSPHHTCPGSPTAFPPALAAGE